MLHLQSLHCLHVGESQQVHNVSIVSCPIDSLIDCFDSFITHIVFLYVLYIYTKFYIESNDADEFTMGMPTIQTEMSFTLKTQWCSSSLWSLS